MRNVLTLTETKIAFLFLLYSILGLTSCSDVQDRPEPETLLSEDKMVEIYTDMLILDAIRRISSATYKSFELEPSEHIYNKYNIDSITLGDNMKYYNLKFETNTDIYDRVSQNIKEKKTEIDSIIKLRDSLETIETSEKNSKLEDSLNTGKVIKK